MMKYGFNLYDLTKQLLSNKKVFNNTVPYIFFYFFFKIICVLDFTFSDKIY